MAFDLLHQTLPDFNEFASWQGHTAASWWETSLGTGVGAPHRPALDRQIFGDRLDRYRLNGQIIRHHH